MRDRDQSALPDGHGYVFVSSGLRPRLARAGIMLAVGLGCAWLVALGAGLAGVDLPVQMPGRVNAPADTGPVAAGAPGTRTPVEGGAAVARSPAIAARRKVATELGRPGAGSGPARRRPARSPTSGTEGAPGRSEPAPGSVSYPTTSPQKQAAADPPPAGAPTTTPTADASPAESGDAPRGAADTPAVNRMPTETPSGAQPGSVRTGTAG